MTNSGSSLAAVRPTRAYILSRGSVEPFSRCIIRASKRSRIRALLELSNRSNNNDCGPLNSID
jgi:hypothetical protein